MTINALVFLKTNIKLNFTVIVVLTAGLLAISGDIALTWTSSIYVKLYSNDTSINPLGEPITHDQDGWIGSLVNIGAMIGPLPFSFIAEKCGRKFGLLSVAIPHVIAYFTFAFAENIYLFYFGRLLGGLAVGGGYTLLPMYVAEISDDSNRGKLSVSLLVFWAFGDMLPYVIGPFVSVMIFNLILVCFPFLFFILFLFIGIETPYYLLSVNKVQEAEESLMALRTLDKKGVEKEFLQIVENSKREGGNFLDIIKNQGLRKALIVSLFLIMFQQLSGINAVSFYLQPIFNASGTTISSDISSVIFGFTIFICSFTVQFLVNRFNRKNLIIFSCIIMIFGLSMMGSYFYIHDSTDISTASIFWVPPFSLILYQFGFSSGISILPWTISSELFPTNVKQISASAVSSTCWLTSFLLTRFFNDMTDLMGAAGTFWFFACWCLVAALFTLFFVPETKGKSFQEIQDIL